MCFCPDSHHFPLFCTILSSTLIAHSNLGSGAVALAHLDGSGTDEAVCTMVQRVQELALGYPEGRIELQLIGGFSDPRHYSDEIFYNVMSK